MSKDYIKGKDLNASLKKSNYIHYNEHKEKEKQLPIISEANQKKYYENYQKILHQKEGNELISTSLGEDFMRMHELVTEFKHGQDTINNKVENEQQIDHEKSLPSRPGPKFGTTHPLAAFIVFLWLFACSVYCLFVAVSAIYRIVSFFFGLGIAIYVSNKVYNGTY